jgi:hypothetical protein
MAYPACPLLSDNPAMKIRPIAIVLIAIAIAAACFTGFRLLSLRAMEDAPASAATKPASLATQAPLPPNVRRLETAHYLIHSSATEEQTAHVAEAVEALHVAYTRFFADMSSMQPNPAKLQLVLYKDQAEFKAHNRSSPWAEAYYLPPRSHAYYGDGDNPVHWMTHEVTHQLNREVAHFRRTKWIDEGLADYFGSSWIADGKLVPGSIDPATYPIWWLPKLQLTGNLQDDISTGRIIPLRAIVSGNGGPDINRNVNLYYIEYWSLTHFLFHYQDGKYAAQYRQLIATDGTLENFERLIGPIDRIQVEWYAYLQAVAKATQPVPARAVMRIVAHPGSDIAPPD